MASTTADPFLESCGLSNREIRTCLALKGDAGLLETFRKLLTGPPAQVQAFLRDFDLTWYFQDELPEFLKEGVVTTPASRAVQQANLKIARGVEGLGEVVRTWCATRRRAIKKAWKKIPDAEAFLKCFQEIRAVDEFLFWMFETQLATRSEMKGAILEPDDIVAFELQKNLPLYVDVKEGILPVDEDFAREPLVRDVLPHLLVSLFVSGYAVEGGNFYVGHSWRDRRDFDHRQQKAAGRLMSITGKDLRKSVPADLREVVSAKLAELSEPYKIEIDLKRCDAYLAYLDEVQGDNWSTLRKPGALRACAGCGGMDRWVGVKCDGCRRSFCPTCIKRGRGSVCPKCTDAGVIPIAEPAVRREADVAAAGAAEGLGDARPAPSGPSLDDLMAAVVAKSPNSLARDLGLVDLTRETVSAFRAAVQGKYSAVRDVDPNTSSVPCCERELTLQPVELSDGRLRFASCAQCRTGFLG